MKLRILSRSLLAGLCFSLAGFATAGEAIKPLTSECLSGIAKEYDIHPDIMLAILHVEGGTVGKNSAPNHNGTYDIGLFQINSMHLGKLKQYGITETQLRNDGCVNARVAAWHLSTVVPQGSLSNLDDEQTYLSALARYHSFTPKYNAIYASRLKRAFNYLYASEGG
jgi:soluble lytic murein transglycosylase-like protein